MGEVDVDRESVGGSRQEAAAVAALDFAVRNSDSKIKNSYLIS